MNYEQMKKWVTKKTDNKLMLNDSVYFSRSKWNKYNILYTNSMLLYSEANSYREIKDIINEYLTDIKENERLYKLYHED